MKIFLARTSMQEKLKHFLRNMHDKDTNALKIILAPSLCLLISILLVWRIINFIPLLQTTIIGWKAYCGSLMLVISFHLILFVLARFYEKIYETCHFLFIYMILILSLYLLYIFNSLLFLLPDQIWIPLSLILLTFPVIIRWKNLRDYEWRQPRFSYKDILIALWTLNAFLFFARYNLDIHRIPFIDEINLWYVAAHDMIEGNVMFAHAFPYPGAGAHPLGVPFISSLPALFWGSFDLRTIYLMPIANLLCLVFFLYQIKTSRWAFIFFLCALTAVFYQRAWLSYFLYGLTYGEGVSTVFLLITTFQWLRVSDDPAPSQKTIWWTSFGIGLLALTKGPLTTLTLPIFLIFLSSLLWTKRISYPKISQRTIFFAIALAILPSLAWKAFTITCPIYTQNSGLLPIPLHDLLPRITHPHQWMLFGVFDLMWNNSNNIFYYGPIALILYALFSKRIIEGIPLFILFTYVFFYYAYCHNYGVNNGDPGSALRYSMPAFLSLFYLGACGFENLMRLIEDRPWNSSLKISAIIALCLSIIWGLSETRVAGKIVNFIMWLFRGFST